MTPSGRLIEAAVAGPLSPPKAAAPLPATVTIVPSGLTMRTRLLFVSAMKRPLASITRLKGAASFALVAGPPSPLKPELPLPA